MKEKLKREGRGREKKEIKEGERGGGVCCYLGS